MAAETEKATKDHPAGLEYAAVRGNDRTGGIGIVVPEQDGD